MDKNIFDPITDGSIPKQLQEKIKKYKKWQYKNTVLLILGLLIFFYLARTHVAQNIIADIGNWGYIGSFFVGILFASTFTIAPAMYVLYALAENLNPFEVAIFAGLGGMFADYLIFRFLRHSVFDELQTIFSKLGGSYLARIFRTPYFAWFLPLIGAALIAYPPVPDELGVGLLGLSKIKHWQFILISFLLNATGIFIVVMLAQSF